MVDDVAMNNMFQDFTGDRCQADRAVVFSFGTVFISTFEQGCYEGMSPVISYFSLF